jgi:hypothetical protein
MDAPRCEVLGESGESGESAKSSGEGGPSREALRVAFALHLDEVEGLREEAVEPLRAATGLLAADSSPS